MKGNEEMELHGVRRAFTGGAVFYKDHSDDISGLDWNRHPEYEGVSLKHVIKGCDTGGLFSAHIVNVQPHCRLDRHNHEHHLELHEVIDGGGEIHLVDRVYEYGPGKTTVIQNNEDHMVIAGEAGMLILAKFFPALI